VWAIPEGTLTFPNEPLVEVTAPIAEAQLVVAVLNLIAFQTTIVSEAARVRIAANGRDVVDFAFRRTHGIEAAMQVARASAIAGVAAASNVEAARLGPAVRVLRLQIHQSVGTVVDPLALPTDPEEHTTTFLVDTYDTLAGVDHAI
jgi:nicotinate phosphoribosyltransferase